MYMYFKQRYNAGETDNAVSGRLPPMHIGQG